MRPRIQSLFRTFRYGGLGILVLTSVQMASAITSKEAETMSGAFSSAFYQVSGTNGWFKNNQTGGISYFWTQAEMIETVIDAYEWTSNSIYRGMITNLLNGFLSHEGTSWTWNKYNDDIMWAVLAFSRGGVLTGNSNYCNVAKANFDACYARAWDNTWGGGLWWTTDKDFKNAAVNGPGAIAAYMMYQIYGDPSYLTKANDVFNWERTTLFLANGVIADGYNAGGLVGGPTTYNQGTFIGAAHFLGYTNEASLAANYTLNSMTTLGIPPQYGIDDNNSGFNAIFNRWLVRYMRDRNLQSLYQGWLQNNAAAAWGVRRADNLSWCQWLQSSPAGTNFFSWDCIASFSAALAAAPTQPVSPSPYPLYPIGHWPLDETSGTVAGDISGNNNSGSVANASWNGSGRVDGCLVFNGVNSSVQVTNKLVNDFSIAMWVKTTQTAGTPQWYNGVGLVDGDFPLNNNDFGTALVGGKFAFGVGNPDVTILSGASINDGNWHLCVATREQASGAIKVYVDGALQGSGNGTRNTLSASSQLLFGAIASGGHYFNGSLDDIRLFTRALDPGEVAALYHSQTNLPSTAPSNLVATATSARIKLSWGDAAGATSYNLKRALVSGGPYTTLGNVSGTSYTDTRVQNNRTYYYVVSGVNAVGEGPDSLEASVNTLAMTAWFKADALTGLANGARVSKWPDLTGNGFDAIQPVATNQPAFVANAINGKPALHFSSASKSYLWLYRAAQDDFTIVLVYRSSQGLNAGVNFWEGAGLLSGERPAPVNDFGISLNANGQVLAGTGNPDKTIASGGGFNNGQPHVVTLRRVKGSGVIYLYVDGSLVATMAAGTQSLTAPNFLALGAQGVLNNFLEGDVAEVQVYNAVFSDADRSGIERALQCKYGIAGGTVPTSPTGLVGVAGNRQIALNWMLKPGATDYTLFRSTDGGATYQAIATGLTASSYVDMNAVSGQVNYYRVAGTDECGTGANSGVVGVNLPLPVLVAHTSAGQINLSWPGWADDWSMFSTTNLTPPVNWEAVTNEIIISNGEFQVSLPINHPEQFFRLAAP